MIPTRTWRQIIAVIFAMYLTACRSTNTTATEHDQSGTPSQLATGAPAIGALADIPIDAWVTFEKDGDGGGDTTDAESAALPTIKCSLLPKDEMELTLDSNGKPVANPDVLHTKTGHCVHLFFRDTSHHIGRVHWVYKGDTDQHGKQHQNSTKWKDRCNFTKRRSECWLYMNFKTGKYTFVVSNSDENGNNEVFGDPELDVNCTGVGCPQTCPPSCPPRE